MGRHYKTESVLFGKQVIDGHFELISSPVGPAQRGVPRGAGRPWHDVVYILHLIGRGVVLGGGHLKSLSPEGDELVEVPFLHQLHEVLVPE